MEHNPVEADVHFFRDQRDRFKSWAALACLNINDGSDNRNLYHDQIEDAKHNLESLDSEAKKNISVENQDKLDALLEKLGAYDAFDALKAELQGLTIPAIGRMTDQAKLEKLLNAYNAAANSEELIQYLTDAEKAKAEAIKARLDTLAAQAVIDLITALGDPEQVTLEQENDVKAARAAYDALTDAQQELVGSDNLAKLEKAEARIEDLKKPDPITPVIPVTPSKPSQKPDTGKNLSFTDVSANNWFYDGVKYAYGSTVTKLEATTSVETYEAGKVFSMEGVTVTATLANGETRNVTAMMSAPTKALEVGQTEVTLTFGKGQTMYHNVPTGSAMKTEEIAPITIELSVRVEDPTKPIGETLRYHYDAASGKLTVTGTFESGQTLIAACYDASGRMTQVKTLTTAGDLTLNPSSARIKIFLLDKDHKPVCAAVTVKG